MSLRAAAFALLFAGCGASPAASDAGTDAGTVTGDAGPPTWESVQAIVARSCAFTSCHGASRNHPMLREELAYDALVSGMSMEIPSMRLVTPGDPAQSWLMHKLDGTMSTRPECVANAMRCGTSMPQNTELLPAYEREMIRAWIRMGAPGPRDR